MIARHKEPEDASQRSAWGSGRPGRVRRIESTGATITRLVRRRNSGYQRVDPDDLREGFTTFTARFYDAIDGGPTEPLNDALSGPVRRRLQQGVHPLEVFGAWEEVRGVLEAALGEAPNARGLLDACERQLVELLEEGVSLHAAYSWPALEVQALQRDLDRLRVGLRLLESAGHPVTPATGGAALTRREREILAHAAAGSTADDIAVTLGISRATVRTYIARSVTKLGAANRTHAVALAVSMGIVVPPVPRRAGRDPAA